MVLIKTNFKKSVSLVTVGRILKKLGMSPQRPLYRSWKQDPERVERWKREEYPAIRARAAAEGATILFAVEALERLKKFPGIVRGFFGDPKLRYISAANS